MAVRRLMKSASMALLPLPQIGLLLISLGVVAAAPAVADDRCMRADLQTALEAIAATQQIGDIYTRDGAADRTISDHRESSPLAEHVHDILECEGKSVPLLVEHLDS